MEIRQMRRRLRAVPKIDNIDRHGMLVYLIGEISAQRGRKWKCWHLQMPWNRNRRPRRRK